MNEQTLQRKITNDVTWPSKIVNGTKKPVKDKQKEKGGEEGKEARTGERWQIVYKENRLNRPGPWKYMSVFEVTWTANIHIH